MAKKLERLRRAVMEFALAFGLSYPLPYESLTNSNSGKMTALETSARSLNRDFHYTYDVLAGVSWVGL